MSPDTAFAVANLAALVCWVLLAALPRQRWVSHVLCGAMVPALFAAAYIALIAARWGGASGGFSSLDDVAALFGDPWLLLAGWMRYLTFDLLVGSWECAMRAAAGCRTCSCSPVCS